LQVFVWKASLGLWSRKADGPALCNGAAKRDYLDLLKELDVWLKLVYVL